ncbi:MAG: ATP-binding protein [Saprospiraceae bacterium]|nr:MAG: ATP-binding protein [Saprospiraceae bacterium]
MIARAIEDTLLFHLNHFPATALLGPRQVGKTTLVKALQPRMAKPSVYLDLENPADRAKINDRTIFLESNRNQTVILDEVQRLPDLFPELRGLIDRQREPGRLLLLGSASYDLLQNTAQSLAGRIAYLELSPFLLSELPEPDWQQHWFRGGFPESYLASSEAVRQVWMANFITTYLEKDLPQLGLRAAPALLERLLLMLAYSQGRLANYHELSKSLGISSPTLTNYVDFLERALLLRRLQPFFANAGKRLVKSHKLYIRDSGIVHHLLRIPDFNHLLGHPALGGSWEGYVLEQVIALLDRSEQAFFYRTADGAELDIVVESALKIKVALEIKFSNQPTLSKGNTVALQDLGNPPLLVVTPDADDYNLREKVRVCSVRTLAQNLAGLLAE